MRHINRLFRRLELWYITVIGEPPWSRQWPVPLNGVAPLTNFTVIASDERTRCLLTWFYRWHKPTRQDWRAHFPEDVSFGLRTWISVDGHRVRLTRDAAVVGRALLVAATVGVFTCFVVSAIAATLLGVAVGDVAPLSIAAGAVLGLERVAVVAVFVKLSAAAAAATDTVDRMPARVSAFLAIGGSIVANAVAACAIGFSTLSYEMLVVNAVTGAIIAATAGMTASGAAGLFAALALAAAGLRAAVAICVGTVACVLVLIPVTMGEAPRMFENRYTPGPLIRVESVGAWGRRCHVDCLGRRLDEKSRAVGYAPEDYLRALGIVTAPAPRATPT